ncbi:hypothetical protein [Serratia marcescens]|uniref:hypothetical protein n=1 Tax=Serratia marcescens TaxID=615 RepID=UPI002881F39C|nr:hypothetical protein [Serratia marcescens]MDT0228519.1 hypothetical protein [Serratia marcescens]
MSYSIKPEGEFEYTFEGNSYQATPVEVGEPKKITGRSFKEDTETWERQFEATLVDGSVVTWDVNVEVGDTPFHDTHTSGVQGLPGGIEVDRDPEFVCNPEEDDEN